MPTLSEFRLRSQSKRSATKRRRRQASIGVQALETRELLTSLVWSAGPALPSARGGAAAVEVNSAVVVAGGSTPGSSTSVVQSLPTSSSWGSETYGIDGTRVGPGFVSTSGGLLVYGGSEDRSITTPLNTAYMYSLYGTEGVPAPNMSAARMQFASATDANSQAYAIGGVDDSGLNLASVERFSALTGTWTTLASLPTSLSGAAAAFDGVNSIYVAGGSTTVNGTTGTSTLYRYNVSANSWTTLATLPITVRDAAIVFGPDGKLDVFGGISQGTTIASVETYNPSSNTWSTNTALPSPVSSAAAVVDAAGRIDLIGGFNASNAPVSTVEVSQVVNSPLAAPVFTTTPATSTLTVGTGWTFIYQAAASGNPLPNYSVVTGPSGLSIDHNNGSLSWTSPTSIVGSVPVQIKVSNAVGSATQSFTLNVVDKIAPTVPTNFAWTGVGQNSVTLSWTASTDNIGVVGYSVYWIYTTGHSGRGGGYTTHKILVATTNASATSVTINGLLQNKSYSLYVNAFDAAGNSSGFAGALNVVPGAAPYGLTATQTSPTAPGQPYYVLSDVANHQFTGQLKAISFSLPTFAIVNPPAGLKLDPNTGIFTWTPGASNLGTTSFTFKATNQFGTTTSQTISIYVAPDLPVPGFVFTNTSSPTFDLVGYPISLKITDGSNTPSTYSIVSGAPAGMTINPVTGVVNWVPTQAGNPQVTFQLTNSFGKATILVGPVIAVASPPQNVTMTNLNTWNPTLTWSPPQYNANLVASYRIWISGGSGLNYQYTVSASTLSSSMTYLTPGSYGVNIEALDAAGNQGDWAYYGFNFGPTVPNPSYSINSNNANPSIQVGQTFSLNLSDANTVYPSTFSIVSAPAGVSLDPTSGLVTWDPTVAQEGVTPMTFLFTNTAGNTATLSLSIYVGAATTDTSPPVPTYSYSPDPTATYAVVGRQVTLQVVDLNTAQSSGFILVSGPQGMTIDPVTGIVTWTPTAADLNTTAYPVIKVINTSGQTNLYPAIPVVFASTVNNVAATGSLSNGTISATWTDPTFASSPIAGYDIYLSWIDSFGNVQTSAAIFIPYGTDAATLTAPAPGITTYKLSIVAVDLKGHEGAYPNSPTTVNLV